MPSSQRKSSVGTARRALQKAHIPYRGDNPEVGKKTGIAVQHVQRKSDGFEPFEEVMQQADGRTPPRPKRGKKKSIMYDDDDDDEDEQYSDDDEYGEMSMQLDSPVNNLASMRPATTPVTNGKASRPRPVAQSSKIDYDKIPSPSGKRPANHSGPGRSNLSHSYTPRRPAEPSSESQNNDVDEDNDMQVDGGAGYDDYGAQDQDQDQEGEGSSPRRTSFVNMANDDDDDDENEPFYDDPIPDEEPEPARSETPKPPPKPRSSDKKGKGRLVEESEEEQVEDDIAQGLDDVNNGQESEEEEREPSPPPRKVKIAKQEKPKRTITQSLGRKENREPQPGVRRSNREHYKPLEYWRGEKVVYGRPDFSQPVLVPHIREIIRIPKDVPERLGKRKRARSRSRTVQPPPQQVTKVVEVENPEEGWDDETPSNVKVLDYKTGNEVERRIAWTAKMVNPQPVANASWSFDKIFGDAEFIASGQLVIPPNSRKPSKATKDNTYIFYVIEGAVNLKVHETSLVLCTGGMFMVPRGNTYFIENISDRPAKIFFTQARKAIYDDEERAVALSNRAKKRGPRSSSAGAMPQSGRGRAGSEGTPLGNRGTSTRI